MKRLLALLVLLLVTPAAAQWQVPNHATPQGRGSGITGFRSFGPCLTNIPFVGGGASADAGCWTGNALGSAPSASTDIPTKAYVDSVAVGLIFLPQSTLATAAVLPNTPTYANGASGVGATLTAGSNTTLTVDGTVAALNDVVLVKNQASAFQNGVYTVTNAGLAGGGGAAWVLTRATYFDQAAEMLKGSYTFIVSGATNSQAAFVLQNTVTTVGTDGLTWIIFQSNSNAATNNTWTGTNNFQGNTFFGDGQHWIDVRSGAHGCAVANATGCVEATTANQCYIDYMAATFSGGIVFISPGSYLTSGAGLIVPAAVRLQGVGEAVSTIFTSTDSTPVTFAISAGTCPSGNHDGGMRDIYVSGYTVAPTTPAVKIGANCNVTIRDSKMLYGSFGLQNDGVDSKIQNNFIWGYTAALSGGGANWYFRNKFDQPGVDAATYGYHQTANISGLTTPENFFMQNDFSGSYTYSVKIDDTGNTSLTHFVQNVFSSPIVITNSRFVGMVDGEIGSTTFTVSNGNLGMVSSYGFAGTTLTGGGSRSCAGNTNLTC